jgi:nucleotide-binding universal stress UspA family protein
MPHDFKKVLCGTDFSEHSYHALDYALGLAKLADGALIVAHFVHVPTDDIYAHEAWPRTFEQARHRAEEMLAELHAKRLQGYPKAQLVVDIGAPGEMLIELAKQRQADVLVTATHGRTELADLFLGGTAEKLIRHAPCAVLVVRHGVG